MTAHVEESPPSPEDPFLEATAPVMPVRLFQPMQKTDAGPSTVSWGITAVRADSSTLDGRGVTVAMLDTGIDRAHAAFRGIDLDVRDFTGEGENDTDGHGTHCAGTLFGRDVDGCRIGVARGVRNALIGKVVGRNGGSTDQLVNGILWAVKKRAHIISMSVGIDFAVYQQRLQVLAYPIEVATSKALYAYRENLLLFEKLGALIKAGACLKWASVLVAAAGNESRLDLDQRFGAACGPPAVADGFLSVAAIGQNNGALGLATFSNINAAVAAPGVDVLSANRNGGVVSMSGTSMAVPHVAGVAALFVQRQLQAGTFKPELVVAQLLGRAAPLTSTVPDAVDSVGAGMVQAPER